MSTDVITDTVFTQKIAYMLIFGTGVSMYALGDVYDAKKVHYYYLFRFN